MGCASSSLTAALNYGRVEVVESKSTTPKDYLRLKTVTATMENGKTVSVSATVFAPNRPRIVSINNLHFEMNPKGNIIMLENKDIPGIIGGVGTTLGAAGINIGEISWGRDEQGGTAMTAINVDGEVSKDVLAKLRDLPSVLTVRHIQI
ncbi:ACT domain-containing protein [bacterium]|nr:ACT domain-containing protein [bacterium]